MAILSKIRDRSLFLILIVGMALFAFVLDPSSIQSFFSASKVNSIGEVNGEDINREEFVQRVEEYRSQNPSRITQMQAVNAVWNQMVGEKIFEKQLEEAGIVVGEKDIWEGIVALPAIQNSPLFKNEANLFDEEKLKEYIANLEAEGGEAWLNWIATERSIKQNLERMAYTSLVSAGLGASLEEGKREFEFRNTKMDAQYVYVPYTTIPDSLSVVSKKDIQAYLEENTKRFKREAARSLKFVKYDIVASEADEKELEAEVAGFINDREEYSNAAKTTVKVPGLKNATDYEEFLSENKSDLGLDRGYKYKNEVFVEISEDVFNGKVGDVFGPYKQNGYYKISKLTEIVEIPDSVSSSHILISYAGATRSTSTRTKEAAKKTADSIYSLVRNNKAKFKEISDALNDDLVSKEKDGSIGWMRKNQAFSAGFDRTFADYIYKNKEGDIDVVETPFGFHIIRIDEQTEAKKAVSLATYARQIVASEETENIIFEKAETLASKLEGNKSIDEVAKETNALVQSALNLKVLDENVPGLGSQRQIVTWAFSPEREEGDSKRFEIEVNGKRGYAVVQLSQIIDEDGIIISSDVISRIRPELVNKMKAAQIESKMKGSTLEEIAQSVNTSVRTATSVNLGSPLLPGVGNEPAVVGAMSTLPIDKVSTAIQGEKGVFVVKVTKKEPAPELENYETFRNNIATQLKGRSFQIFKVLEEAAEIKDYRGNFF